MSIVAPPGVFDILPAGTKEEWKRSYIWGYLENSIRSLAACYCFQEIRTPLFERTELFLRGVGEDTDVVSKEMYTFVDRGDRSLTLRPEGTAPVMRAFIEHHLQQLSSEQRFFYIAPMFRYERSQAGRYRQHHQFGVEAIGSAAAECDAEVIDLLYTLCSRLGLSNLVVSINSIGTEGCRSAFRSELVAYLEKKYSSLSQESQIRVKVNPLRVLDSKDPGDRAIVAEAPSIQNFLSEEALSHFETVLSLLSSLKIPYKVNPFLVRGLDYYNKTVFEVTSDLLGAQDSVGGGGRYDGLLKKLGGPDLPAFGFGMGLERLIQTMLAQSVALPPPPCCTLFLIPMGAAAKRAAMLLVQQLRRQGVSVQMDLGDRKVGKALQFASQLGARYAAVLGDNELESNTIDLKLLSSGEIKNIELSALPAFFTKNH